MAEVLGLVSSGIAVGQAAAAITTSLIKLKALWNELRDVPDDLAHLIRELEVVYSILDESESASPESSRSLDLARKLTEDGAKELEKLAEELNGQIRENKRWLGKVRTVRVVLKKDQVKKLKSRLKSCLRLLELAKQCQFDAALRKQPELLAIQLASISRIRQSARQSSRDDQIEDVSDQAESTSVTIGAKQRDTSTEYSFKIRLKLLQRMWHLYGQRSRAGWNLALRVFNVISSESELAAAVRKDDVETLKDLLTRGEATPLTIIVSMGSGTQYTLLAWAIYFRNTNITKLLLNEGARVLEETFEDYSSALGEYMLVNYNDSNHIDSSQYYEERLLQLGKILLQNSQIVSLAEHEAEHEAELRPEWTHFPNTPMGCTLQTFRLLKTTLQPNYYATAFHERAQVAVKLLRSSSSTPDAVRAALGRIEPTPISFGVKSLKPEVFERDIIKIWKFLGLRYGRSAVEKCYRPSATEIYAPLYTDGAWDRHTEWLTPLNSDKYNYPLCGWRAFVAELMETAERLETPLSKGNLLDVMTGALSYCEPGNYSNYLTRIPWLDKFLKQPNIWMRAIRSWLEMLHDFGVDLEEYGRDEILQYSEGRRRQLELIRFERDFDLEDKVTLRLISLEIGPDPENWRFWFSDPTDEFAGQFWDMIEHPERRMPGAWDDTW